MARRSVPMGSAAQSLMATMKSTTRRSLVRHRTRTSMATASTATGAGGGNAQQFVSYNPEPFVEATESGWLDGATEAQEQTSGAGESATSEEPEITGIPSDH
jgi:hypothetical protein